MTSNRRELMSILAELSDEVADVRFGQLICNLSYLARGFHQESIWDVEDDELLKAARAHLEQWRANHSAAVQ